MSLSLYIADQLNLCVVFSLDISNKIQAMVICLYVISTKNSVPIFLFLRVTCILYRSYHTYVKWYVQQAVILNLSSGPNPILF